MSEAPEISVDLMWIEPQEVNDPEVSGYVVRKDGKALSKTEIEEAIKNLAAGIRKRMGGQADVVLGLSIEDNKMAVLEVEHFHIAQFYPLGLDFLEYRSGAVDILPPILSKHEVWKVNLWTRKRVNSVQASV